VKPSGTVSQLVNSASGIHPRFAKYYIRRVRNDIKDPLTQHLVEAGVPFEPDVMNPQMYVFSFPQKAPETSISRDEISAIEHLKLWLAYQLHWCEHKPSVTISVTEHEWPKVGAWVWEHFDALSGVSFLPYDGGSYRQAPYEEIDEQTYNALVQKMPKEIDWDSLIEEEDNVEGVQTLACTAGGCEM
jgi:ribonucleoside-diphosphate reductase alpha chain